ncbi:MAG: hypothetical protein WA324_27870 [Bryobacteraceae bacterium]
MSNFETFALVTEGNTSTAPNIFVASTKDSLATMLVAGYLNDIQKKVKLNDIIYVNYLDLSVFPLDTGESALRATFNVNYDPALNNWNLIQSASTVTGIGAYGLRSTRYTNAGGSATTVVTDSQISPNMVVLAAWQASANAVSIEKVTPGIGTLTILSSGDPGASTLTYIAFTPSVTLQNIGVYVARYSNAGGSATVVINDANITTAMEVNASIISSVNAVIIEKVTVTAGVVTILCSGDPGVSVFGYVGSVSSAALTALGLYVATYSNAGGSATTTITDSSITATSDVVANWASSANAVNIQKITASASTLTILSSGDPGVSVLNYQATPVNETTNSSNALLSVNNLSDVASASTALANLNGVPLSGGQMTGSLLFDRGTATSTAGAATINHQAGVVTTEALTTAAAAAYAFTYTDSRITTASVVLVQLMGGTNTTRGIECRAIPSSGSAAISIYNNNVAGTALNGTLIFGVVVI